MTNYHSHLSYRKGNRGYIVIIHTLLFLAVSLVLIFGIAVPMIARHASAAAFGRSVQAFMLSDSAAEEAMYRLTNGLTLGASQSISLGGENAVIQVENYANGKIITITAPENDFRRDIKINLETGTGASFHYGIQAGAGGFTLENSSSVTGNVFSGGPITGSNNYIYGDAVSSGPTGIIDGIRVTGSAHAHTIQNSTVGNDAYYTTKIGTLVGGVSYPNSPDPDDESLPIPDEQIAIWEAEATAGGTLTVADCSLYDAPTNTCTITTDKTWGTKKIPFNLEIRGSGQSGTTLTVDGHLWVTGAITTSQNAKIRMHPSLGNSNVVIIADDPSNPAGGGTISIGNNTTFASSGSAGSYVFMISQNNSAESGGSVNAISMGQGASALVAYASHGQITLGQSVSVKEATAYRIILQNSANVTYDTGLPNVLFTAGPGGGYTLVDWTEI